MTRGTPGLSWTVGTGKVLLTAGQSLTFTTIPTYGKWGSCSFPFGISQTNAASATIFSATMTMRDWQTFYDQYDIVAKLARSGIGAAGVKPWSTTLYHKTGWGSAAGTSKKYFWGGVSFGAKSPAGIYKFRVDVHGYYSQATKKQYDDTYSYVYANRPRNPAITDPWVKKTAHPVFLGTDMLWMPEPWGYASGQSTTTPTAQVLSSADQKLSGVSFTEKPVIY